MPTTVVDELTTRYEVTGSGPPVLMFSPGGFDSTLDSWRTVGIYRRLGIVDRLAERFTCITFDRRESGRSGGRLERIGWSDYVAQGVGLLNHLGLEQAHLMGGCVGCSTALATAVAHPERVLSMVLYSPAGGVHYRLKQLDRFAAHLAFVQEQGLAEVTALAQGSDATFTSDPRVGPWVAVLRSDRAFAERYAAVDPARYRVTVTAMSRLLFDRDTVPGAEPEDLLTSAVPALVVPGQDSSHAPSAAHYLTECLPLAQLWDVPVAEQTADTAPARVVDFLVGIQDG